MSYLHFLFLPKIKKVVLTIMVHNNFLNHSLTLLKKEGARIFFLVISTYQSLFLGNQSDF